MDSVSFILACPRFTSLLPTYQALFLFAPTSLFVSTWRKRKGIAKIRLEDGTARLAELHWYEGHGKGRKETKIKKYLE